MGRLRRFFPTVYLRKRFHERRRSLQSSRAIAALSAPLRLGNAPVFILRGLLDVLPLSRGALADGAVVQALSTDDVAQAAADRCRAPALWQNADAENALDPVALACLESAVDVLKFCNPQPSSATLERIKSPLDGVLYTAAWLNSRLDFLERLAGIHEEWIMFAPNVPKETVFLRARLIFDDDTEIVIRQLSEPDDLTKGGHGWLEERVTNHEYWAYEFPSCCWGYCNLLAHRHPRNDEGVPLKWVVLLYAATYRVPPGVDALAHYQEQNRLTATPPRIPNSYRSQTIKGEPTQIRDFYLYTVKTHGGKQL